MIVSGAKHACATCIRGHRSSSCTHADRPLFEIRKKGRPVSQCPHCRDLRKIKSCHTKCECGETPAEQSKTSKCKCHSGQACSCAGPVQVYQYIPPVQSNSSSTSQSNSNSDGPLTPNANSASMLHTFQSHVPSANLSSANHIKTQSTMPYPSPQIHREQAQFRTAVQYPLEQGVPNFTNYHEDLMPPAIMAHTPNSFNYEQTPIPISADQRQFAVSRQHSRRGSSSISRSTRSIGINTDPLPPGLWPTDLFQDPVWMQTSNSNLFPAPKLTPQNQSGQAPAFECPKVRHMPIQDIPFDRSNLTESTAPVPTFSTFYHASMPMNLEASNLVQQPEGMLAIDHFADREDDEEEDFDSDYWDKLFDVPGCALPGVQCRCGDGCSCQGCQTHKDNADNIAFDSFKRMDFSAAAKPPGQHPPGCCDTRSLHQHQQPPDAPLLQPHVVQETKKSCCGGGK